MLPPIELRLLFFVDRHGEPRARLVRTDDPDVPDQVGSIFHVAGIVQSLAEAYEVTLEAVEQGLEVPKTL